MCSPSISSNYSRIPKDQLINDERSTRIKSRALFVIGALTVVLAVVSWIVFFAYVIPQYPAIVGHFKVAFDTTLATGHIFLLIAPIILVSAVFSRDEAKKMRKVINEPVEEIQENPDPIQQP